MGRKRGGVCKRERCGGVKGRRHKKSTGGGAMRLEAVSASQQSEFDCFVFFPPKGSRETLERGMCMTRGIFSRLERMRGQ